MDGSTDTRCVVGQRWLALDGDYTSMEKLTCAECVFTSDGKKEMYYSEHSRRGLHGLAHSS